MARPTDLTVLVIDTPTLGDRSYLVHDGEVAFVVDPQRDIDRVLTCLERARRAPHARPRDPHPQRLRHRRPRARRARPAPQYLVNGEDDGRPSPAPRSRDGDVVEVGGRMRVHGAGDPRPHVHPPLLRPRDAARGRPAVGVFTGGSLLYGATGRPDLLGRRAHRRPGARTSTPRPTGSPTLLPDDAEVFPTHGFGSLLLRHPVRRDDVDHRPGEAGQPGPDPGRGDLRRRAARRARRLAGLLRAHGAGQRRRPRRADLSPPARSPTPTELRRRIEAGRVGRRPAPPHRLRRRPRPRHAQLRPRRRLRHLPRLADPLGHARHPARRRPPSDVAEAQRELVRIGIDRPAAHGHRRPGGLDATASPVSFRDGDLRRPRPGPPPPRGRRPRRAPRRRARRRAHRRRGQHPAPRAAGPARRGAGRGGVGALRRRLPRVGRRLDA